MKTRISKAYRGRKHIGWKKTVAGREWFLGYGVTPAAESKAIALAEVLEATWTLKKAAGATELTETDFEEAKDCIAGRPRWASAGQGKVLSVTADGGVGIERWSEADSQKWKLLDKPDHFTG